MKKVLLAVLAAGVLTACTNNKQTTDKDMVQTLQLTQEWDKVFPQSDKVSHKKVTFETQYGLTLAAVDFLSKQENVDAERIGVIGKPNPVPENKQLLIIPNASHCDLYDGGYTDLVGKGEPKDMISWDKLEEFFKTNLQ